MKSRLIKAISTHTSESKFSITFDSFLKKNIVVSSMLTHGNILFDLQKDFDLVNVGICQLMENRNKYYWKLGEPLAVKAILQVSSIDPEFAPWVLFFGCLLLFLYQFFLFSNNYVYNLKSLNDSTILQKSADL